MLAVEGHFLRTYGGGFTENFYSLKRERILRIKGGEAPRARIGAPALMRETLKLQTQDIWKNLAIMVGLPYLKRKLDESYDIHVPSVSLLTPSFLNRDRLPVDASIRQRIIYYYKWFLRNVYPSINAAYYFSLLAFNFAYLFDNTKYSSPFLWLVGTRIRRLNQADHHAIAIAAQSPAAAIPHPSGRPGQTNSLLSPLTLTRTVYPRLLSSLRILLPTSIFALKFLEWWHASDFARQLSRKSAEGLDLPPPLISGLQPPKSNLSSSKSTRQISQTAKLELQQNTVSLSSSPAQGSIQPSPHTTTHYPDSETKREPPISASSHLPIITVPPPSPSTSSLCPICMHAIQTPTSAQTGYVFCYKCIFKWVEGSHERQLAFMDGAEEGWGDDDDDDDDDINDQDDEEGHGEGEHEEKESRRNRSSRGKSRYSRWESGKGRCAVTGRRVLGGTDGLRRVMM